MNLRIATEDDADQVVVALTGELDIASAPALDEQLSALIAAGCVQLVIDLTGLRFCDSTGIGTFLGGKNICQQRGGYLRLAAPNRTVTRVLGVVGLLDAFPTYQTVEAARRADTEALVVASP